MNLSTQLRRFPRRVLKAQPGFFLLRIVKRETGDKLREEL